MAVTFSLGLDLGSDTLKIAYACSFKGKEETGKIVGGLTSVTAIPAIAFYDDDRDEWFYGEEVEKTSSESFGGVVKIKTLLSLLALGDTPEKRARNEKYYFTGNEFPKFYFPRRRNMSDDFAVMSGNNMTFTCPDLTPKKVCENYFDYVAELVRTRIDLLCKRQGETEHYIRISLIYPPNSAAKTVDEIGRLVKKAFGIAPQVRLSMPKALSVFARHNGKLKEGEKLLIFNMGEMQLSVVKAGLISGGLAVDGVDGHSAPLSLGGNDIDDAVAEYLETRMHKRETMGSPSYGSDGHIQESGLSSKQYLFVKDIKMAKILLGITKKGLFDDGVPVSVSRDLFIQKKITREQFKECVGITHDNGVAAKIADYIEKELVRELNKDVKKVFLSGGLVETVGLVDYLRRRLKRYAITVSTFENDAKDYSSVKNDGFNILEYEDAVYAQALGGALALHHGYKIKTLIALSYGMRLFDNETRRPFYAVIVEKGTELKEDVEFNNFYIENLKIGTGLESEKSEEMNIISSSVTQRDINARVGEKNGVSYFIGKGSIVRLEMPRSPKKDSPDYQKMKNTYATMMRALERTYGFKVVASGSDGKESAIIYRYNGLRVTLIDKVFCRISARIDRDGRAITLVENDTESNAGRKVKIRYMQSGGGKRKGEIESVDPRDVEFVFDIDSFSVVS